LELKRTILQEINGEEDEEKRDFLKNFEFGTFFWENKSEKRKETQIFPFLVKFHSWVKQPSKIFRNS
jgi:hypothetical protein